MTEMEDHFQAKTREREILTHVTTANQDYASIVTRQIIKRQTASKSRQQKTGERSQVRKSYALTVPGKNIEPMTVEANSVAESVRRSIILKYAIGEKTINY